MKSPYTLRKRLTVRIFGRAELGMRQPEGFLGLTMFYLAYCNDHGYFEDYEHGFDGYLRCPKCKEKYLRGE
jgi:hypothetical protein